MLALPRPDGGWFELAAVIVRLQNWGFAVRFDSLDPVQQLNLRAPLESIDKKAMASTRQDQAPPTPKPDATC